MTGTNIRQFDEKFGKIRKTILADRCNYISINLLIDSYIDGIAQHDEIVQLEK